MNNLYVGQGAKQIVAVAAVLGLGFGLTFLALGASGLLSTDKLNHWLSVANQVDQQYVAAAIVLLLAADLLVAMPTLTLSILAGYFLGPWYGGTAAASGMMLAGVTGYAICRWLGPSLLMRIYKDQNTLNSMRVTYNKHAVIVLLMCRAMPILPEVCCCLSGANKMPVGKFVSLYACATLPYAFIAASAGASSTVAQPAPALMTAVLIPLILWLLWAIVLRRYINEAAGTPAG